MIPFVVPTFLFLESLDRAEPVDAESKRPLPAVDGAIKVFLDFLRRGLPRVSLFFFSLPFRAEGAIGGLRYRDRGNCGAVSVFLVGELAGCSARSSRYVTGGLDPRRTLLRRQGRTRGCLPFGPDSGPVAPWRKGDGKLPASFGQGDVGDAVAVGDHQHRLVPDLSVEFLAFIDFSAFAHGFSPTLR